MVRKIRYKLFFVLSLTGVVSVLATALSIHWNTERNFRKYRDLADLESLDEFAASLQAFYLADGSWDNFTNANKLVELFDRRRRGSRPPPPRRNTRSMDGDRPERPGAAQDRDLRGPRPGGPGAQGGNPRGPRPGGSGARDTRPREITSNVFRSTSQEVRNSETRNNNDSTTSRHLTLPQRLILFDANGNKISGIKDTARIKKDIIVNGKIVGSVGMEDGGEQRFSSIERAFLDQERYAFFLAFSIVSIICLLIASVYSKQFETPLTHLARLARRLTEGEFSARSKVSRKDELGELSIDLNILANTLEKNEAMREQWIADTSHELKTPVTILRGEIEALLDGIREPNNEALTSLKEEIEHLSKLIDDLNTLSQADNKSLKFDMKSLNIDTLIEDVCCHAHSLANEKGFKITSSLSAATDIRADPTRLKQVFDNLIMNSFRYSHTPGSIHIHTKCITKNGASYVEITLEDTPPCPSNEEINRIFERFYRTESSRNRKTGGRGLGLAICKRIVESHDGSIHAYSASSGGMGIRIHLPKL